MAVTPTAATSALLSELTRNGVKIETRGDNLRVVGASRLNDDLRASVAAHKMEILEILKGINAANDEREPYHTFSGDEIERGRRRLSILAKESGHPIADLLDWYQHDLGDLGTDTEVNVRAIVGDYPRDLEH